MASSVSSSSLSSCRSSISSLSTQSSDLPGGYGTANATSLNWRLKRPAKVARRQTKLSYMKERSSSVLRAPRSTTKAKAIVNAMNREFPLRTFLQCKSLRTRAKTLSRHTSRCIIRSHRPAPLNLRNPRCFQEAAKHAARNTDFDEWCAWLVEQKIMKRGLGSVLKSAALKYDLDEWICFMKKKGLIYFAKS